MPTAPFFCTVLVEDGALPVDIGNVVVCMTRIGEIAGVEYRLDLHFFHLFPLRQTGFVPDLNSVLCLLGTATFGRCFVLFLTPICKENGRKHPFSLWNAASFFYDVLQSEYPVVHLEVFDGGAAVVVQRTGVYLQFMRNDLAQYGLLDRQFRQHLVGAVVQP